ncbi:MAG: hypothetical protein VX589_06375 [Myxococcota bacterium]|nr:hypothetical protein [Myxococcota bacterium]
MIRSKFGHLLIGLASILAVVACSKQNQPAKKQTAKAKQAVVKTFEVPTNVLMYTGTDNPDKTLGTLYQIAQKVTPMVPDPRQMVAPLIQGFFRLSSPVAIDMKKPLRFVLFDPKGLGRDPSALIVGIKDKKSLAASVGKIEQKTKDRGNEWSYLKRAGAKHPVFVNALKDHMVLTRHPDTFPKNKAFIEALVKEPFSGSGMLSGQIAHAFEHFKDTIDQELASTQKQLGEAAKGMGQPKIADGVDQSLKNAKAILGDMDTVTLRLDLSPDGLVIRKTLQAKPGTALSKTWGSLESRPHTLLDRFGPETYGVASFAVSKKLYDRLASQILDLNALFMGDLNPADSKAVNADYTKFLNGEVAGGLQATPNRGGLSGLAFFGLTDGGKAREAFEAIQQRYTTPEQQAKMAELGVKLTMNKADYTVQGLPAFVSTVGSAVPGAPNPAAMMGLNAITTLIGKNVGAIATGPEAKTTLETHFDGKQKKFTARADIERALKTKAPNMIFFGYINPIKVAQKARLSGMNPFATTLADVKADSGLALTIGHESGQVVTVLDIPTQLLTEAFGVFERMKGSF